MSRTAGYLRVRRPPPLARRPDGRHRRPQFSPEATARNQAIRLEINEAIRIGLRGRSRSAAFLCECGALGCNTIIEVAIDDYDELRAHLSRFVVDGDHVISDVDTAVAVLASGAVVVEAHLSTES